MKLTPILEDPRRSRNGIYCIRNNFLKFWFAFIKRYEAYNEQEDANFVAENIHKIFDGGDQYKDTSVLYRSNAQSRTIEEFLLRQDIPYVIYGGVRFYERMEIKNAIS